jgi:hypothetical protein
LTLFLLLLQCAVSLQLSMVRSMDFGVIAKDMNSRDGEMGRDVCGSSWGERWGIDVGMGNGMEVNEISNGRASVSCNLNVSEDSNGADINDNGLTFGLGVLDLG